MCSVFVFIIEQQSLKEELKTKDMKILELEDSKKQIISYNISFLKLYRFKSSHRKS